MNIIPIHSRIQGASEYPLHICVVDTKNTNKTGRVDVCPDIAALQLAVLRLAKGKTFDPHYHISHPRTTPMTQETWIVIAGKVRVTYYDTDQSVLDTRILRAGDVSITLAGGHNYTALDKDTLVIEVKNGPYEGRDVDKQVIGVLNG